ncbi:MAG: hypothetical protein ACRELT_16630 [Longimicrobiales bacterium]
MSRQLVTTLVLALTATACAARQNSDGVESPASADSIFIDALNENFYDARVHAVYTGGQRRSLGTIAGNGGRTQTALPWEPHALVFEVSFILSGAAYESHPLEVARGQQVEVRLPPNIDGSGFFRRVLRRSSMD